MTFNIANAPQLLASAIAAFLATTIAVSAAVGPVAQLV